MFAVFVIFNKACEVKDGIHGQNYDNNRQVVSYING